MKPLHEPFITSIVNGKPASACCTVAVCPAKWHDTDDITFTDWALGHRLETAEPPERPARDFVRQFTHHLVGPAL